MDQYLAILMVAVVAAAFFLISYYRRWKLMPTCDRFAMRYCDLADSVLTDDSATASLHVEALGGDLLRMKPLEEQTMLMREILGKPVDDAVLAAMRDLYLLRDDIQARASNGSLSKNKYNAITNQLFDSANTFFSILNHPDATFSQKDLDNFHYYLQNQKHIRNVTLPSIVSKDCSEKITVM